MLEAKILTTDSEVYETIWVADPAVNVEASDLKQWMRDGTGLILRPQEKASKIRYRDLCPIEKTQAAIMAHLKKGVDGEIDPMVIFKYQFENARFGLLSIEGLSLERDLYDGVKGIGWEAMRQLDRLEISDPMPDGTQMNPALEPVKGIRFLTWLGGLISARSFRGGR